MTRAASPGGSGPQVWESAEWRAGASAWIDEQLGAAGIERLGEVEQPRVRPWGTVLTAATTAGPVWFKAPGPETAFEVGLYELLRKVAPAQVVEPIAADVERGWILLPDGGPVLGEQTAGDALVEAMLVILPQYARLQRTLAPYVDDLLGLGVADMRPEIMPARFDQTLDAVADYIDRQGDADRRATLDRVTALRETFVAWCEQLAAAPGDPSLDHNDLHPWNIFAEGASGATEAKFYDWGDSVIAYPFASMLVALGYLAHQLDATVDDPRVMRVRDAYLAVFSDLGPHAELVETMQLACRVGKIARALVWHRALGTMAPDVEGDNASAPFEWMASLLEDGGAS